MPRPVSSSRRAKPCRARLCVAGPRVRAQVSVQAQVAPGLARAEPEAITGAPTSDSNESASLPSTADVATSGAPPAASDVAVSAAPAAPFSASEEDANGTTVPEVPEDSVNAVARVSASPERPDTDAVTIFEETEAPAHASAAEAVPQEREVEYISAEDFPYQLGDMVTGRVVFANPRGARIAIHGCKGVLGYMPKNRGPYAIRSARDRNPYVDGGFERDQCVPKGLTRRFTVVAVPTDMSKGGKGPLLAANNIDQDIIWGRLSALDKLSKSMRETVRVEVHGCVDRGLLVTLFGIRGFVPVSHVLKEEGQTWLAKEDLEKFVGQEIEVSMLVVDREKYSFTASMINARSDRVLRGLRIGSLVWCRVRRMTDYGAFLSIEDTFESALLHITNVSWHRVPTIDSVFNEGDRVRAVVIGMDDGFSRLSVSTRDLEEQEGDMLQDPQKVYDNAERGVQRFLEHVAKWEEEQAPEGDE